MSPDPLPPTHSATPDPDGPTVDGHLLPPAADGPAQGVAVPGYEVLGELGRGGMGVVYQARHLRLNRVVALKMILPGGHSPSDLSRFRAEALAVANLQHPGIVQVFEVGEVAGQPFFSLELCPSGSLAARLAGTPLPPAEAAALVEALARAVHAVHEKGLVHRDLKPANVLIAADGTPKVTDFGLAKRLDDAAALTRTGSVMGTPSYMAPEQARGLKDIGPPADIWSLGSVLYECLTGRPPFKGPTSVDTLLQVLSDEPVAPRALQPKVPRDLETVTLRCLHKDPPSRYPTALALAEDLRRWLDGQPVLARPVGPLGRAARWARRSPAVAALLAAALASLAAGALLAGLFALQASEERALAESHAAEADRQRSLAEARADEAHVQHREALAQARAARRGLYVTRAQLAQQAWRDNQVGRLRDLLDEMAPAPQAEDLRGFEWRYLDRLTRSPRHSTVAHSRRPVNTVAFSPDGRLIASGGFDATVRLWGFATARPVRELQGHRASVNAVAFSPDGTRLATAGHAGGLRVWRVADGALLHELKGHSPQVFGVAFSPDGRRLASASADGTARLWDLAEGREVRRLGRVLGDGPATAPRPGGHANMVWAVAFSPDGGTLVTTSLDQTAKVWDAATGQERRTLAGHRGYVVAASFTPDGRVVATASRAPFGSPEGGEVRFWEVATGKELASWRGFSGDVHAVAFSPDGLLVAAGVNGGLVQLWDVRSRRVVLSHRGHGRDVLALAFSPDGRSLVSGSADGEVKIWDALAPAEGMVIEGGDGAALAFSPDGKDLLLGMQSGAQLRRATDGRPRLRLHDPEAEKGPGSTVFAWVRAAAFRPDGRQVAYLGHGSLKPGVVVLADPTDGRTLRLLRGHTQPVSCLAFTPDGSRLLTGGHDRALKVWSDGREVASFPGHRLPVLALAVAPHGGLAASLGGHHEFSRAKPDGPASELIVWDLASGAEAWRLPTDRHNPLALAFHPARAILAVGAADGSVGLYDAPSGRELRRLRGHVGAVAALAFSPRGDRLATGGPDRVVRLWDWEIGQPVLALEGHSGAVKSVAWSPDGRAIASSCGGSFLDVNEVRLWEADVDPTIRRARYDGPAAVRAWHVETARLAQEEGRPAAAVFHLTRLLAAEPQSAAWRIARGRALAAARRWAEAEADLRQAGADLDLAEVVMEGRGRTAEAARLYARAFAADPRAADDLATHHRYNAACAAARAASGSGTDVAGLSPADRAGLRRRALGWLWADLHARKARAATPAQAAPLRQQLAHWLADPDLHGVRDSAGLARLPPEERTQWQRLWAEVGHLAGR